MIASTEVRPVPGRLLPSIAAGLALLTDVVYIAIIVDQGDGEWFRVAAVATCIALAGAAAAIAGWASLDDRMRIGVFAAAAGALLALGVIGMFSIGLPLFAAGILMVVAWSRSVRRVPGGSLAPSTLAFLVGAVVPVLAVVLT